MYFWTICFVCGDRKKSIVPKPHRDSKCVWCQSISQFSSSTLSFPLILSRIPPPPNSSSETFEQSEIPTQCYLATWNAGLPAALSSTTYYTTCVLRKKNSQLFLSERMIMSRSRLDEKSNKKIENEKIKLTNKCVFLFF